MKQFIKDFWSYKRTPLTFLTARATNIWHDISYSLKYSREERERYDIEVRKALNEEENNMRNK